MKEDLRVQLKDFFKICYSRLEDGDKQRQDRFLELDLFKEITEELADVANYAFLEYVKLLNLKRKIDEFAAKGKMTG